MTGCHAGDDDVSLDAVIRILTDDVIAAGIGRKEERQAPSGNAGL
tara:strand:- start:129 stop:263 length:135 start_codon:yes stop_codon:yes gene_type:complete